MRSATSRARLLFVLATFSVVAAACGESDEVATTTSAVTTTTVQTTLSSSATVEMQDLSVFFATGDGSDCAEVTAFPRQVPAAAEPVRAALDELVAGPTADEQNRGAGSFFSTETAGTVRSATIDQGLLVVDFVDFRRHLGGASSSCGSAQFLAELNTTVFEFPEVQRVRYEIEGSCYTFTSWLQFDCVEFTRSGPTTPVDLALIERASRSGCTPDTDELPAGEWFGYLAAVSETEISFDLACWFEGDAAVEAVAADGAESPPPNGYYIRNDRDDLRTIGVGSGTVVSWLRDRSDPSSFETIEYRAWFAARADRSVQPGVWLIMQAGDIVAIEEQWPDPVASLPGEAVDPGPFQAGVVFGVIGVDADDVLNVRAAPGADQEILDTLGPLTTGLVFSGRARRLSSRTAAWYEVDVEGVTGWVHAGFVAPLAGTFDITSEVVGAAGDNPIGSSVEDIGAQVVAIRSQFADPPPRSVIVDRPTPANTNTITYDLVGFHDDSVYGERLRVFVQDISDTEGVELQRVEATYICMRGSGSGAGLCP